ncbi:MAG: methyltransferase [Pseudohongiella sp.]|nr:methyltransferase [Pseudohongiella sp.]
MIKTFLANAAAVAGVVTIVSLAPVSQSYAQDSAALSAIIAGEHRSDVNKARDNYRHPLETLSFFGVEPNHTVVEIFPGNGWYTEILAPYVREHGKLIAAGYPRSAESSAMMQQMNSTYDAMLATRPDLYDRVEIAELHPRQLSTIAEPGTVDFILDFRNAHNWLNWGAENMLMAWRSALKDGGMVGVVDHRMEPDREPGNGYIHEKTLIDTMEEYGFEFVASSEINANPGDTKDHPGGVWNLPPNLRDVPAADQAKYLTIGESDRLTMLFRKR